MKNLLLFVLLFSVYGFGQMSLKKLDGTPINNGDVFSYNQLTDPEAYLGIKVYNSSPTDDLNFKVRVMSITNANGSDVQLCFGNVCVANIVAGNAYPPNFPANVAPDSSNGNFDHFLNMNGGINPALNVVYVLKFYMLNDAGVEFGNSITITYRYNANLSTDLFANNQSIQMFPNPSTGFIKISTKNSVNLSVIDVLGKVVYNNSQVDKNTNIDLSNIQKGVYLVKITGENISTTEKLILK